MKKTLIALTALTILGGCQLTQSPTGRTQALMYSSSEMSTLGSQSFEEIKKQEKVVTNANVNNYVRLYC